MTISTSHIGQRLALRTRIALWSGGWLLVCCLALTVYLTLVGQGGKGQLLAHPLIGFVVVACFGAVGSFVVTGIALRPVRAMAEAVTRIEARTLGVRLAFVGPPDELKQLADAFDAMLERLDTAFAQQGQFVADAAHELRTPIASLRTAIEVVCDDPDATRDDYRAMTVTLRRSLARLERLATDLLLLAQEDIRPVGDLVALGPVVEEVFASLAGLAAERNVRFALSGAIAVTVCGDELLLTRAITNLVENGVRYNHAGGAVSVTLAADARGEVALRVTDTGCGIAPEALPHVFERFYRADGSRARHNGGAGLGLAIAQAIIERHGGCITLESTSPTGSVFTIHLPEAASAGNEDMRNEPALVAR